MACLIAIHGVVAFRAAASQPPSSIIVFGAADDCSQIDVTIDAGSVTIGPGAATVDQQGGWSVEFQAPQDFAQGVLTCGTQARAVDVSAICHSDPNCKADIKLQDIPCQIANACPTFNKVQSEQVSDANNGCNADGTRRVTFSAELSASPGGIVVVEFVVRPAAGGNDIHLGAVVPQPGQTFVSEANLLGGDYFFQLNIVTPTPCDGPGGFLAVQLCPQPPGVPVACPTVVISAVNVGSTCDAQDRRQMTASATVTPGPGNAVDAELRLLPVNAAAGLPTVTLQTRTNQTSAFQLQGMASLPAGDYEARVDITRPASCGDAGLIFNVPVCPGAPPAPPPVTPPVTPPVVIPPPAESVGCGAARIIGLALIFAGIALLIGGSCSGNVLIAGIGVAVFLFGAAIIVAWTFLCPSISRCFALNRIIQMLELLTIVLAIAAVVFAIFGIDPGCVIGVIVGTGLVGALVAILDPIAQAIGCRIAVGLTAARR